MVVEWGAGFVSTLLETCKRMLLLDSVVNLLACAKPRGWQVSFKTISEMINIHSIYWFMEVTTNNISWLCRTLPWSLFFRPFMHILIKWRELWKPGSMMQWTCLDHSAENSICLLEYFLIIMVLFMVNEFKTLCGSYIYYCHRAHDWCWMHCVGLRRFEAYLWNWPWISFTMLLCKTSF